MSYQLGRPSQRESAGFDQNRPQDEEKGCWPGTRPPRDWDDAPEGGNHLSWSDDNEFWPEVR
jgi:hypothetical protein